MFNSYQDWLFRRRRRFEDPDLSAQIIRADDYLFSEYKYITERLISGLNLEFGIDKPLVMEVGSAGGITKSLLKDVVTTDVRSAIGVDLLIEKNQLPTETESLDGLFGKDVLHHISEIQIHFDEIVRTLKVGASAIYSEPNWNIFSRLVFTFLHPEPFYLEAKSWAFDTTDPMFANQALPYIVFERDRNIFFIQNPNLHFTIFPPTLGLSYLLGGGVYNRTIIPSRFLIKLSNWERKFPHWMNLVGFNRIIKITRVS
jgi:SAM-dependent methyltransferase